MNVPGPRSRALAERLRTREQRNVTFFAQDFPIFWESAHDATVVDVDGNEYVDCTAAFGVANAGHCNPCVVRAIEMQARQLIAGMGDVHPSVPRVRLLERLAEIVPAGLTKTFLASTGSEAVEAALKTAMLFTGKSRFAAYRGGYHGLSFGALGVSGLERFRAPFAAALPAAPLLLEYPHDGCVSARDAVRETKERLRECSDVAALVIEPIQGRAGCIVAPDGYLAGVRDACDECGIVLIVDEIYTGFGRTGEWFAVDREGVVPDILCAGKAIASGFPLSAAIGRPAVMDAWPLSTGEALHTSTFLGSPLGCAAAIATIDEIARLDLAKRAARLGAWLGPRLEALRASPNVVDTRGRGLFWAVALRDAATAAASVTLALRAGAIFLQSGDAGDAIVISPPLVISDESLARAIDVLEEAVSRAAL